MCKLPTYERNIYEIFLKLLLQYSNRNYWFYDKICKYKNKRQTHVRHHSFSLVHSSCFVYLEINALRLQIYKCNENRIQKKYSEQCSVERI